MGESEVSLIKRIDAVDYGAISGKLEILLTDCRAEIQRLLTANEALKGLCEDYQAVLKSQREVIKRAGLNVEATPFNCGINGDPPQVDHAWTPPCKVWCGRKQCAAKDKIGEAK